MRKLKKVVQIWFDDEPDSYSTSGLFLELEDGRVFRHAQDGYVKPFEAVTEGTDLPKNSPEATNG